MELYLSINKDFFMGVICIDKGLAIFKDAWAAHFTLNKHSYIASVMDKTKEGTLKRRYLKYFPNVHFQLTFVLYRDFEFKFEVETPWRTLIKYHIELFKKF